MLFIWSLLEVCAWLYVCASGKFGHSIELMFPLICFFFSFHSLTFLDCHFILQCIFLPDQKWFFFHFCYCIFWPSSTNLMKRWWRCKFNIIGCTRAKLNYAYMNVSVNLLDKVKLLKMCTNTYEQPHTCVCHMALLNIYYMFCEMRMQTLNELYLSALYQMMKKQLYSTKFIMNGLNYERFIIIIVFFFFFFYRLNFVSETIIKISN